MRGGGTRESRAVELERRGEVAWLIINRADKANALTAAMMEEMAGHVAAAARDDSTKDR